MNASRRYSVIFYGCLLVTVVLVGVMLFSGSDSTTETVYTKALSTAFTSSAAPSAASTAAATTAGMTLRWSNEQLRTLMNTAIESQSVEASIDRVALSAPDTITVAGSIARTELEAMLESSELDSKNTLLLALKLLPEDLSFAVAFSAAAEDGTLVVEPLSVRAESVTLPASILPAGVTDAVNASIHDALTAQRCTLESLSVAGEMLYLTCNVG
ncbi:MAG: hypothetical protein VB111_01545 [Clostridiaceae bacterium]|nr:hypothetical protein [Clostridiaceae bacterium]